MIEDTYTDDFSDLAEVMAYDHVKDTRGISALFGYNTMCLPRAIPWLQLGFLHKYKFVGPEAETTAALELKKLGIKYQVSN